MTVWCERCFLCGRQIRDGETFVGVQREGRLVAFCDQCDQMHLDDCGNPKDEDQTWEESE